MPRLLLVLCLLLGHLSPPVQAQVPRAAAPDSAHPAGRLTSLQRVGLRVAVPSALLAVGVLAQSPHYNRTLWWAKLEIQEETQEAFAGASFGGLDNYTRHVPLAVAYGLMATGHRGERTPLGFTLIYLASHELSAGVVSRLKRGTAVPRPYNPADLSSFPSSHTAQAFLTATLLHEQYGRQYPWVSVGGFAVATATGAMRVLGNQHWTNDVLAGAAIGFLSAETAWHLYPALTRLLPERVAHKLLLVPTYAPGGGLGLALAIQP